jgi:sporulation protein YlmC with PRC-barrel domain
MECNAIAPLPINKKIIKREQGLRLSSVRTRRVRQHQHPPQHEGKDDKPELQRSVKMASIHPHESNRQTQIIGGTPGDGPGPEVMAADTLEGNSVVNTHGEKLGEVTDIMLDVPSGRVAYAVLSCGGFLGIGEKLFAIPWRALTLDAEEKQFILNIDKERLENAPGFDKDHWPSMADSRWASEVHDYYGQRNYWLG